MLNSSRRARRLLPHGRLALALPTALLAVTALAAPGFADDADPAGSDAAAGAEGFTGESEAVAAQETCKDDDGWLKIEPVDAPTKDITASGDQLIVAVCAKSGTNVVTVALNPGQASYTFVSGTAPWDVFVNDQGEIQDISHVSYLLADEPQGAEIEPPVIEPDDPCGPDNAAYPPIDATTDYSVAVNDDGSVTLTALGDATFAGGEKTHTFPVPVDSGVLCTGGEEPIVAPEVPVDDPCEAGNAVYGEVPDGDYTVEVNDDGSITLTALGDATFVGGGTTHTYPVPVEVNTEACPVVDGTRVVLCTYPDPDAEPDTDAEVARAAGLLGTIVILDVDDLADLGFAGLFPFDFVDGDLLSIAIRYANEGEVAEDIDAIACGVDGEIDEEVPGEVGGIAEEAPSAGALPNTGGPAGWLLPLGAGLVLAGTALLLARRTAAV